MSDEDTAARLRRIRRNRLKDWMNAVLAAGGNLWVGADAAQSGQPLIAASAVAIAVGLVGLVLHFDRNTIHLDQNDQPVRGQDADRLARRKLRHYERWHA
ncbi:Uncharacterised protein [Mycobacteroides abscessus subsp. abscessus]|nr:Uncharacterised protein [Mycobacteroides abscessus subsp. abscessus]